MKLGFNFKGQNIYTYTYIHTYIHTHTYTYIHTYIHTHTRIYTIALENLIIFFIHQQSEYKIFSFLNKFIWMMVIFWYFNNKFLRMKSFITFTIEVICCNWCITKVVSVMGSHESNVSLITSYYRVVNGLSQDKYLKGKLQITPLKFGGDWILHREIS